MFWVFTRKSNISVKAYEKFHQTFRDISPMLYFCAIIHMPSHMCVMNILHLAYILLQNWNINNITSYYVLYFISFSNLVNFSKESFLKI